MIKSPTETNLLFVAPSGVIFSLVEVIYLAPTSESPILIQFTPSGALVKYALIGLGEEPRSIAKSSPNFAQIQFSGISNGISSSVISGSGYSFLILPDFMSSCFSAWICC